METQIIVILALVFGFYMAWNIGANDVANAFGTAVGSGALTFGKAIIIAAVFEFAGAFLAGSHVTDTIKSGIVQPHVFAGNPVLFAEGMLAALLAASIWLHVATFFGQPVSTTHAIIGAIIGFGVIAQGIGGVQWQKLGRIAASWFVSPVVGGFLAFLIYVAIRKFVLRAPQPAKRAHVAVPISVVLVTVIIASSILPTVLKWVAPETAKVMEPYKIWMAVLLGLLAGGGAWKLVRISRQNGADSHEEEHRRVERWFSRLQIMTACYMSFAHGANDVANSIGPIAGVLSVIRGGSLAAKTEIPTWLLAFGGFGIVVGLATFGYRVIVAIGKKITEITPSRGFSAEMGTATTVLLCSALGLPISTTFVLVGAVMGVGFARGFGAIDLAVIRRIFMSWVITIPVSAVLAAIIYWIIRTIWPVTTTVISSAGG